MATRTFSVEFVGDAKQLEAAFKKSGNAAQGMGQDVTGATKQSEKGLRGLGDAAKRTAAVIGSALAIDQISSTFDDSAVAAGRLGARLGLTADEAKEFDAVSKRVYRNNFGQSMTEAADMVGMVHQALGLQGKELQTTTENVIALSDAFADQGADTQIITESVRAMKSAYPGMSEKKILDQITHAFQEGTGTAGDLQDTLQEYPAFFKTIGLTSKDMFNFLELGMKSGARNTDFLADALKEFTIRVQTIGDTGQVALAEMFPPKEAKRLINAFADGGKAGREAFFTVMQQLAKTEDEQERYTLAVELFGTKAEDLTGVLDKMTPAFLRSKNAQDDSAGATEHLGQQYTGFQNKLEGIKRFIETSFVSSLGDGASAFLEFGSQAGIAMIGLTAATGTSVASMVRALGGKLVGAFAVAKKAFIALRLLMMTNPFIAIATGVAALTILIVTNWDKISDFLSDTWSSIKDTAEDIWGGIKDFLKKNWDKILVVVLGPVGLLAATIIKNWSAIRDRTVAIWNGVRDTIRRVVSVIRTVINSTWNAIRTATATAWAAIQRAIVDPTARAISGVRSAVQSIAGWLVDRWMAIRNTASEFWGAIRRNIVTPITDAVATIKGKVGEIVGWLRGKWEQIRDFTGRLWGQIESGIGKPLGKITGWLEDLRDAAESVLGFFRDIAGVIGKLGSAAGNLPFIGGPSGGPGLGTGTPSAVDQFTPMAAQFGLGMTSGFRPGDPGWHGQDRARDYAGAGSAMLSFAQFLASAYGGSLLELIHTPLGFGVKNGQVVGLDFWGGDVNADHYDHVHVAFHDGGIVPGRGTGEVLARLLPGEGVIDQATMRQGFSPGSFGRGAGSYEMVITNWREGRGYIREIADDRIGASNRESSRVYTAGMVG